MLIVRADFWILLFFYGICGEQRAGISVHSDDGLPFYMCMHKLELRHLHSSSSMQHSAEEEPWCDGVHRYHRYYYLCDSV